MLKLKANIIIYNIFKYCKSEYNEFQDVKLTTKKVKKYKNEVHMSVDAFHYGTKININYNKCSYKQKGFNDYKEGIFVNDLFKSVEINDLTDAFIICTLHEFGHVYRVLTSRANVEKYNKQIKNLKKWELRNPNNSKNRMKASKKYRAIEEERESDRFAVENYELCKKYLKDKGVI